MVQTHADEQAIFEVARKIDSPESRQAYLQQMCGSDVELQRRIDALLKAYADSESFLEPPFATVLHETSISEGPGTVIGPYKLLQQIGEGGMGVVFMAEQSEPIHRTVALKIIKPGMDTRQVIARFEAERQALALMDHPNIARVIDAGTTESGRPYFVMDLVKGVPITEYCDQQHLSIRERLELMATVCHAVQHAHQKGIIHRDLKPSNVLVAEYDGKPVPKVIDFGVAKATAQRLTERTMFTEYGQLIGTFEYMSPEQARFNQLDVDTRSDIYSLGVLLYELLTGSTPLEKERLRSAAFDEILRLISEEDPPKPSTRLSSSDALPSIAANRHTEPTRLNKDVSGELDWIVMKALEKDRNRRYETASGFAADVERHLHDEPVEAGPPSVAYKFRKFVKRNKTVLAIAAMALTCLVALGGGASWLALDQAARNAALTQGVNTAITQLNSSFQAETWPEAKAALEQAESLLAAGNAPPNLRAQVEQWRTDFDRVLRLEEIVLASAGSSAGERAEYSAKGHSAYEQEFRSLGIDVDSLSVEEAANRIRALRIAEHLRRSLDDWTGYRMDLIYGSTSQKWDKPAAWAKRPLSVAALASSDDFERQVRQADERFDMAAVASLVKRPAARNLPGSLLRILARDLYYDGQPDHKKLAPEILLLAQSIHPDDFWVNYAVAHYLSQPQTYPRQPEQAVKYWMIAQALRPHTSWVRFGLAKALCQSGKFDDAIDVCRKAVELQPDLAAAYFNLAMPLAYAKRYDESVAASRKAIELQPNYIAAYVNLGELFEWQGKLDEAVAIHRKLVELQPDWSGAHNNLGTFLAVQGKYDEAIAAYRKSIELNPRNVLPYYNLGEDYYALGKLDEAVAAYRDAIKVQPDYQAAHAGLARVLEDQGKSNEANSTWKKAIDLQPTNASQFNEWAWALAMSPDVQQKQAARAVALADRAVKLEPTNGEFWNTLGIAQYRAGNWRAASDSLNKSMELRNGGDASDWFILAMAHWQLGNKDEARNWYEKAVEWMDQDHPKSKELIKTRTEATKLLGITEPQPTNESKTVDNKQLTTD